MNKLLKFSTIVLLTSSTSLMAQMTGPSIAVSLSKVKASTDGVATAGNNNNTSGTVERNFAVASIDLDYAQKINNEWNISYGINYIPGKGKIGDVSRADTNLGAAGASTSGTATAKGELSRHITAYIEPTYMINSTNGVYAKLGYIRADLDITSTTVIADGGTFNDTVNVKGIQYGIGYKTAVSKNLYAKIEGTLNNYKEISVTENANSYRANPEVRQATVSIGYTF
jgi:Outer membrane protein beta-barrel domain